MWQSKLRPLEFTEVRVANAEFCCIQKFRTIYSPQPSWTIQVRNRFFLSFSYASNKICWIPVTDRLWGGKCVLFFTSVTLTKAENQTKTRRVGLCPCDFLKLMGSKLYLQSLFIFSYLEIIIMSEHRSDLWSDHFHFIYLPYWEEKVFLETALRVATGPFSPNVLTIVWKNMRKQG